MTARYVKPFLPLVDAIAETLGKNCEVVLHDLSKPEQSIVRIANGHITGRDVGGPATGLVLRYIGKPTKTEALVGYRTRTNTGAELKSTTMLIKNAKGLVIGALCINIDITGYLSVKKTLEQLCLLSDPEPDEQRESPESFESSVDSLIHETLEQSISKTGKPVAYMRKEDKLRVIRDLKERGLFLIKGSARRISRELNVSLATTYKYLEEIE
jgi:predicted transcriptional regulator YheO